MKTNMFKTFFTKVGTWFKAIPSIMKKVPELIKKIPFGKIGGMIKTGWGWIKGTAMKVPNAIKGICGKIKGAAKPVAEVATTVA